MNGESIGEWKYLVRKFEGNGSLDDPGVNWKIILKCILKKWDRGTDWFDLINDRDK